MEPVEPVLKNIYRSNTYRKDLSRPYFDNEPRAQEKQQVKNQGIYTSSEFWKTFLGFFCCFQNVALK